MARFTTTIIDLFAGPGGWSEGLRLLGLTDIGIELDPWACATRAAAGHLTLQSFPPDYPVQGTKTAQFRQVGDAVPPLLAAHILAAATGRALDLEAAA